MPYLIAVSQTDGRWPANQVIALPDYQGGKVSRAGGAATHQAWAGKCFDLIVEHDLLPLPPETESVFRDWLASAKDGDYLRVPRSYRAGNKEMGLVEAGLVLIFLAQAGKPVGTTLDAEQKLRFVLVLDDSAEEEAPPEEDDEEEVKPQVRPRDKKRRPRCSCC